MFNTPYNFVLTDDMMEHNNEPSMTVPDMSYSIQEILDKFVRGISLPVMNNLSYDDDVDVENMIVDPLRSMNDLSDIVSFRQEVADFESNMKQREETKGEAQTSVEEPTDS